MTAYSMPLKQRILRGIDELVFWAPLAIPVAVLVGVLALPFVGRRTYTGVLEGVNVKYWEQFMSCRELTLEEPNGLVRVMYDENDDNILGNYYGDFVQINRPNGVSVTYAPGEVIVESGEEQKVFEGELEQTLNGYISTPSGEMIPFHLSPTDQVFSEYTDLFNYYRNIIFSGE